MEQDTFDAIVIGSGISGGWAAKELCEHGMKTLVLERGRNIEHLKDYPTATMNPWEFKHRGRLSKEFLDENPLISKAAGFGEDTAHFFIKDNDHPYVQEKPFDWIRGYQVGGKSLIWGRACQRWSDYEFKAPAKYGYGIEWPIGYDDIAPWYSHVEKFIGVCGNKDGIDGFEDKYYYGRNPTELILANYRNLYEQEMDFVGGYTIFSGSYRVRTENVPLDEPQIGADFKHKLSEAGNWYVYMYMQGETIPRPTNQVYLSKEKTDQWGIPLLVTDVDYDENAEKMVDDFLTESSAMLEKIGCKDISANDNKQAPGLDIHEMGGVRMGKDPKTSLLNRYNQLHACKNVFVTDGACMTSTGNQSPSILYMALTARAAIYAAEQVKNGTL